MKRYLRFALYLILTAGFSIVRAGSYEDFFRAVNVDNAGPVKELLARGFDANAVNEKGQVALYLAMRDDSPKVADALLAHPQTKVDLANAAGETPLMMAALRGQLPWVEKLLDHGAEVNRAGWTPLHYAATGPETKVVALLLDRGAQIEAASPNRTTPLMMAARYGNEASVKLLLARGASLRARNDASLTAVDFARLSGRAALTAQLEQAAQTLP